MAKRIIDEIWWVPVLLVDGFRPLFQNEHMRTTRKQMIEDFIMNSYSGAHDWKYRRKLGWRAMKVRITGDRPDR